MRLETIVLATILLASGHCYAQDARDVARQVLPSVVVITTFNLEGRPDVLGSGFFVAEGIVATNFHVIEQASDADIRVAGSSESYQVSGVVAFNKQRDLALLKVARLRGKPLTLLTTRPIEVGEEVYALGNPEGITAPISHGSSGGPVVNKRGEVVGVAESFLSEGQNLNFAVPANYLASLLSQIGSPEPLSSVAGRASVETLEGIPIKWTFVAEASNETLFYDPDHVERPNAETLRVWIRFLPRSSEERTKMAASIEGQEPLSPATYGYQVWHNEYNCKEFTSRFISVEDYDTSGKRVRFIVNPVDQRTWSKDKPGSVGGDLLNKICGTTAADKDDYQTLIGTYTGTWASDIYDVSGVLVLTMAMEGGQLTARIALTGSDYLNEDTLVFKLTPMGSGVWKMDYKGKKSKVTGTGIFRSGHFVVIGNLVNSYGPIEEGGTSRSSQVSNN